MYIHSYNLCIMTFISIIVSHIIPLPHSKPASTGRSPEFIGFVLPPC